MTPKLTYRMRSIETKLKDIWKRNYAQTREQIYIPYTNEDMHPDFRVFIDGQNINKNVPQRLYQVSMLKGIRVFKEMVLYYLINKMCHIL